MAKEGDQFTHSCSSHYRKFVTRTTKHSQEKELNEFTFSYLN